MKKFSKTILLSLLLATGLGLGACGSGKSSSQATSESGEQSQTSEQSQSSEESISSETSSEDISRSEGDENWVDYVHDGSVNLPLDYEGRDFYVDGIGQFELKTCIDGDTAHFTPLKDSLGKGTMKARFFGIDTPESTGKVQQYGKAASRFTKEKLKEAAANGTIVISSAQDGYGEPQPDSTGSRYVSLIWINLTKKNAPKEELVLLNLWIVQEGLSWVKNVQDMPQYADTFYAAEEQARVYKLNLHSGHDDGETPTGDYTPTSLLEIKYDIAAGLNDPDPEHQYAYDNVRITVQGTVAGFSDHILYLQDFCAYDPDAPELGGEYAGINIFVGMTDIASKYTKVNTYLQVSGLAQFSENFGFQMTDVQGKFPVVTSENPTDAVVIYTPAENEQTEHNLYKFDFSVSQLSTIASAKDPYDLTCLNCYVKINETVTVNRFFINDDLEITLYFEGASFNCYLPFAYKGDPNKPTYRWVNEDDFKGKSFTLEGVYVLHKTQSGNIKFQIIPNGQSGLVWVQDN